MKTTRSLTVVYFPFHAEYNMVNNEVLLNCVSKNIQAYILSPLIVFPALMGGFVSLVVWNDMLFVPSLYIEAALFFLFDLADSCLGMSSIDLLSYLSWSALNSRLIDSGCIPRDQTNHLKGNRRRLRKCSHLQGFGYTTLIPKKIVPLCKT